MKIIEVKKLFVDKFYKPTYQDWRVDKVKAGKDIVGEKYEDFRETYYKSMGFDIGNGKKVFGSLYDCDTVVMKNDEIVILEEDKGHYVDSTFLNRALTNAAQVMFKCIEDEIKPPKFVLSCPTKMNTFDKIFEENIKVLREDIQKLIRENFIYLPLCKHDRISKTKYFESEDNCFELNDELINNQNEFVVGVLNGT